MKKGPTYSKSLQFYDFTFQSSKQTNLEYMSTKWNYRYASSVRLNNFERTTKMEKIENGKMGEIKKLQLGPLLSIKKVD